MPNFFASSTSPTSPTSPFGTSAWGSTSSAGTTLPTEPTLPDWLPTDPNAINQELLDTYGSIGNFGANKAARAIDRTSALNRSMGTQAANAAASDYANRIMQAGGTALATGAVKAQALLPVLKQNADTQVAKQGMLMDARKAAASMRSNLASQLASSRNAYLGQLAGTYTTMRGQNIQYNEHSEALGAAAAARGGSNPYGGNGSAPFMPGYITNSGPIQPSTGWYGANNNNVLLDPTIPVRIPARG